MKYEGDMEISINRRVQSRIPTPEGEFVLYLYTDQEQKEHLALVMGEIYGKKDILVRIHSECFTGDVLGSLRCDCGEQLQRAMHQIALDGEGVVIYLRQEGRGIGLLDKLRAYNLQDHGLDTVEANLALGHQADERDYSIAADILTDLGVKSVQLMTNNPLKIEDLIFHGIPVSKRIPLEAEVTLDNANYLITKARRMHHLLALDAIPMEYTLEDYRRENGTD
jgi:GTP cyclohydrolase II